MSGSYTFLGKTHATRAMEHGLTMLALNFLPAVIAPAAHKGRSVCIEAFKQYFANKGHENSSTLVKSRVEACVKYGISVDDTARLEVGGILAVLDNTVPAAFWMLSYVFSSSSILADLRLEVENILQTDESMHTVVRTLDATAINSKCPLLHSVFQETLRYRSCGASTREVMEDTLLNDRYVLKEGSIIQMPGQVVHDDPAIWGPTVKDFDPRRFLKRSAKDPQEYKAQPAAFRGWGGGTTLCPGRHFASMEVMCCVAMFAMRYDLEPVCGEWRIPAPTKPNIVASMLSPSGDIEVVVRPRKGFEHGSWAFTLGESRT